VGRQCATGDGHRWLDIPQPPPHRREPAERRFTIHYGFALLAVLSLAGTLLIGIPLLVDGFSNTTTDAATGEEQAGMAATFGVLWMLWGGMWTVVWVAFAIQHTLRGRRR
jgi:hypothetical protein